MAHKLDEVLAFFEKFGGDNFKRFDGTVHNMSKYASILKEFIKVELVMADTAGYVIKEEVKEFVEATKLNVAGTISEVKAPEVKKEIVAPKPEIVVKIEEKK